MVLSATSLSLGTCMLDPINISWYQDSVSTIEDCESSCLQQWLKQSTRHSFLRHFQGWSFLEQRLEQLQQPTTKRLATFLIHLGDFGVIGIVQALFKGVCSSAPQSTTSNWRHIISISRDMVKYNNEGSHSPADSGVSLYLWFLIWL